MMYHIQLAGVFRTFRIRKIFLPMHKKGFFVCVNNGSLLSGFHAAVILRYDTSVSGNGVTLKKRLGPPELIKIKKYFWRLSFYVFTDTYYKGDIYEKSEKRKLRGCIPMKDKTKNQCGRRGERVFSNICIMPSLIGVLVFFMIPFCIVIYYSLISNPVMKEFVMLDNYTKLFSNAAFIKAVKNTAFFSLVSVPLSVILSLGLAMLLERKIPGKSIFRTFFLSPLMVPTASVVLVWQVLFHNHGTINQLIERFGGQTVDWIKSPYGQVIIICMFLWKNLGYNMILFMSALCAIPRDIIEVADLEGAGSFYKFLHIKLRYLSPTILFVLILSLINSFKIFREVYLLTGNYPQDKLYMLQHFMNNTFNSLDYQKLSAAAVLFALVMIVIMALLLIAENIFGKDVEN